MKAKILLSALLLTTSCIISSIASEKEVKETINPQKEEILDLKSQKEKAKLKPKDKMAEFKDLSLDKLNSKIKILNAVEADALETDPCFYEKYIYRDYLLIARFKLTELTQKVELTEEEKKYFDAYLQFGRKFFNGFYFTEPALLPIKTRVLEFYPELEYVLKGASFSNKGDGTYTTFLEKCEIEDKASLSDKMKFIKENPWKKSLNPIS